MLPSITLQCYDGAVGKGVCIAVYGNPSHSYGVSLAVWDHTVLPSTRHKRTHPALNTPQPDRLVLDLPTI